MTDPDLEELRRTTERGSRLDAPAASAPDDTEAFVEAIAREVRAFEEGEATNFVGIRDANLRALVDAISEHPDQRKAAGDALYTTLGRELEETYTRTDIIQAAVRIGIREGAPELGEAWADGIAASAREQV